MPLTRLVLYREEDGSVPLLDWLAELPPKAQDKCRVRLHRLAAMGNELRRPEADYLRDGIYELRVGLQGRNYRMLYFFHGSMIAVLAHGITKEREVPPMEIARALARKAKFAKNPGLHTFEE